MAAADRFVHCKEAVEMGFRSGGWCGAGLLGACLVLAGCGGESTPPANSSSENSPAGEAQPTNHVAAKPTAGTNEKASQAPSADQLHPVVLIKTSVGDVTVRLDGEHAPITVSNFLDYVERGFYNETIFHQIVDGYIVLGGGFAPDLSAKPALPPIRNEAHNGLKNRRGTIAMARRPDAIDSSTSQFFFNLGDNPALDHKSRENDEYGYCVFGEVIEGLSTVEEIANTPVRDTDQFEMLPQRTVKIESVKRLR